MEMLWYAVAVLVATFVTSLTDWYFMGVLFHDKYMAHPETWRNTGNAKGERLAVALSTLVGFLACAMFIHLALHLGLTGWHTAIAFAVGAWLAVAVPLIVTNGFFIKIHPLNSLAMCLGWLARLLVCAICTHLFLG
jgi:hypothetical protein